jgi:ribose transport system permease protein
VGARSAGEREPEIADEATHRDSGGHARTTLGPISRSFSSPAQFFRHYTVVLAFVVAVLVFSVTKTAQFFTVSEAQTVLTGEATLFAVSLPLTVALAAGELDLSIGGTLGLTTILVAFFSSTVGLAAWEAVLISLGAALCVGLLNGFFIVTIGVNGLITTLAMGTLLDGAAEGISRSQTIGNLPAGVVAPMQDRMGGVGLPFWYGLIVLVILWYVLRHLRSGRYLYFTGEGREAARLAGIHTDRIRVVSLVVSSLGAWLAGLILVGQTGAGQAGVGDPYLLPAYAAVFLGAATITPGRFNPVGTFVAVLLLAVGTTGLQLFGLSDWPDFRS